MTPTRDRSITPTAVHSSFAFALAILIAPLAFAADDPAPKKPTSPTHTPPKAAAKEKAGETPKEPTKPKAEPKEARPPTGIRVVSSEKAREGARPSPFLQTPGTGRYDDPIDWREIPAWRQASFFGIKAQGQFFVYVVDCSGSMSDEERLERAKDEVRRSVMRLQEPQKFKVIFYNDRPLAMPGDFANAANLTSKNQLLTWMNLIDADGDTDPRGAISLALSLRPDAVFLLSDGVYPDGTVDAVAKRNPRKVPIHCVDLSGGEAGDQLKRIARDSGGQYASRPTTGR